MGISAIYANPATAKILSYFGLVGSSATATAAVPYTPQPIIGPFVDLDVWATKKLTNLDNETISGLIGDVIQNASSGAIPSKMGEYLFHTALFAGIYVGSKKAISVAFRRKNPAVVENPKALETVFEEVRDVETENEIK